MGFPITGESCWFYQQAGASDAPDLGRTQPGLTPRHFAAVDLREAALGVPEAAGSRRDTRRHDRYFGGFSQAMEVSERWRANSWTTTPREVPGFRPRNLGLPGKRQRGMRARHWIRPTSLGWTW